MNKKLCIILIVVLIFSSTVSVFASEIELRKDELKKVQNQLKELDNKQLKNRKTQNNLLDKIYSIESDMRAIDKVIEDVNNEMQATQKKISEETENLSIAEEKLALKKDLLNSRLRTMYKLGSIGYAEVLLGANSFEDLLNRAELLQKIFIHDRNLIQFLKKQRDAIEESKKKLEAHNIELEALKNSKKEQQNQMLAKSKSLQSEQSKLKKNLQLLEQQEDAFLADANKIEKIINQLTLSKKYVGGEMVWPVPGKTRITSSFGYRIHPILKTKKLHTGVDVGVPTGTNVLAAQSGTVIYADWMSGYGKVIMIDHGGGYVTLYAHNSQLVVSYGEKISVGEVVAKSGSTGRSTGPHLHFEVRENGKYIDPLSKVKPR